MALHLQHLQSSNRDKKKEMLFQSLQFLKENKGNLENNTDKICLSVPQFLYPLRLLLMVKYNTPPDLFHTSYPLSLQPFCHISLNFTCLKRQLLQSVTHISLLSSCNKFSKLSYVEKEPGAFSCRVFISYIKTLAAWT